MEFRVLGRLRVAEGSEELTPTRARERAVIAALLLRRGRAISTGEVVDGVWGEAAPPTARTALHGLISSLRRRLGSARIVTVFDGYRLDLGAGDSVDADRVAVLAAKAAGVGPTARSELLREAVELFEGEPFERLELADGSALAAELAAESARLAELRVLLEEQRAAADLELGRHEDVVPRLDRLVEEHPLRESLRTPLMLALYRSGRQADALRVAQDARRILAQELGVEPGPALQRLERLVLEQDPALGATPTRRPAPVPAESRTAAGLVTFLATDASASALASVAAGDDGAAASNVRGWAVLRFERAGDAATAAAAIIRASGGRTGAGDQAPRIGLHSATIDPARGSAPEPEIDRARQLARVAHMGQALLSRETRDLLREAPMAFADVIELGDHRLPDLRPPQPVYQLVAQGLGVDFPPLPGLEARRTNLPFLESPLIGREQDLDELTRILRSGESRLVTLTGPGGIGKTRLALHAAAELVEDAPGGIFFVALDGLSDPHLVGAAITSTVGIADELGDRPAILVLDNFEHLLEATPVVAAILEATPLVQILATSRTALGLASERVYPVSPLAEVAGVALFAARARTASRAFRITPENSEAVGALVRAVDGLPLAIELAGSRMAIVPPAAILERIQASLRVLDSGRRAGPARHRALDATIDWSHDLLEPDRRRLFADLAVFAGGWTLDAAERVCAPDLNVVEGLANLADDSLVRVAGDPEAPRFRMLDTIRAYASGKLDTTGRRAEVEGRHADFYLGLAEAAAPHLRGNPGKWLGLLAAERDNLRAALDRLGARGDHAAVANLSGALWRFWYLAGDLDEGRQRLDAALAAHAAPDASRARVLIGAAVMAVNLEEPARATKRASEALQLHETIGDDWGAAYARFMLAAAARALADPTRARELDEAAHAAFRSLGDEHTALLVSRHLAGVLEDLGDRDAARDRHQDNLRGAREQGNGRLEASTLGALATIAFDEGRVADARWMLRESLGLHRELRDRLDTAVDLARAARTLSMSGQAAVAGRITAALGRADHELGTRRAFVRALLDDTSARVGRQLSTAELEEARREGSGLTLDAALRLALDSFG